MRRVLWALQNISLLLSLCSKQMFIFSKIRHVSTHTYIYVYNNPDSFEFGQPKYIASCPHHQPISSLNDFLYGLKTLGCYAYIEDKFSKECEGEKFVCLYDMFHQHKI